MIYLQKGKCAAQDEQRLGQKSFQKGIFSRSKSRRCRTYGVKIAAVLIDFLKFLIVTASCADALKDARENYGDFRQRCFGG